MAENGRKSGDDREGGAEKQGKPVSAPGTIEVRTSDAGIAQPITNPPPERAVAFETRGLSESPGAYPFVGSGGVVQCADKKGGGQENRDETNAKQQQDEGDKRERTREKEEGGKKHRKQESGEPEKGEHRHGQEHKSNHKQKNNDEGHERQKRHGDEHRRHGQSHHRNKKDELRSKLPRWPTLVIVCIMSLVCGASGAWGYSALFGASQSADKGKSSGKGGKSSEKGGGSDKSGGGDSDSDQGAELKELKKNFGDLDDGIKQLTARIDRLTESLLESRLPVPEYFAGTSRIARMAPAGEESPPILPNALPTQLNVLRRKVDQMSDLPARVHALEELLPVLQEEIKMLEARRAGP